MTSPRANKIYNVIIYSITILFVIGCGSKKSESNVLSVTIEPQKYFLEQIVGDKFEVVSLVSQGSNPESFDPTPLQIMELNKSRIYFKIGFLGIENALIEKIKNESSLNIIDCSTNIDIIKGGHNHEDCDEHEHHHAHDGGDPHYWSSTTSARIILENMLKAILEIDPDNKEVYISNYEAEIAKINDKDSIIKRLLSDSESNAFVIYHPALSYFAKEYNLEQLSIEYEGKNPSPTQLKKLIDEAMAKNVNAVLIQQEFDIKNAETVAAQIGAQTYTLNLLSYNWHDEMIEIAKAIAHKKDE